MCDRNRRLFLFFMLYVFLSGSLFFLKGFFPDAHVNANDDETHAYGTHRPTTLNGLSIKPPTSKYDQIILMIIDAFRFDFVHRSEEKSMPFLHKHCCSRLKLRVAIPTVTMPRIKSLMTGTISNFIDIIRNLGETEQLDESLLHVLRNNSRSIVFAGDHTWTSLFPSAFTRHKANIDSFFVNDFYEGDRQVVTTMRKEILEPNWSLFIMHFLGLDHIGHVEGSNSPKIVLKLQEMDEVIKEIHTNAYFENRLLLVTGDHGMRNGGGHGGSTEEELTVPLISFSKNCFSNDDPPKDYNQIDLAVTLAILISVEIPKTSIGRLIPELLQGLTREERLYAYFYNAYHLLKKANIKYGENKVKQTGYLSWFDQAQSAHENFITSRRKNLPGSFYYEEALKNYHRVAEEISQKMSESLVNFDYGLIGMGIFLTTTATLNTLVSSMFTEHGGHRSSNSKSAWFLNGLLWILSVTIALILNLGSQELDWIKVNSFGMSCFFTFNISIGVYLILNVLREIQRLILPLPLATRKQFVWSFPKPLLVAYLLTVFLLGSSSFIEFEHLSWHYLGTTGLLWLIIGNLRPKQRCDDHFKIDNQCSHGRAHLISFLKKQKIEIIFSFIVLGILRLLSVLNAMTQRRWTQYMQMFREYFLTMLFIGGLLFLLRMLQKFQTTFHRRISAGAAICIFLFHGFEGKVFFLPKTHFGSLLAFYTFWIFIAIIVAANSLVLLSRSERNFQRSLRATFACSILIAAILQQLHNVILLPCLLLALELAYKLCDSGNFHIIHLYKQYYFRIASKTFATIFLANMFFFYQGNSNSLATIDLNPGYIGQSTYSPIIVAIFVTLNTYSAPIHAFLYLCLHALDSNSKNNINNFSSCEKKNLNLVMSLYTAATLLPVAFYLGLMILFRYHLFIYSVFAPKAFYECYRVLIYFIIYTCFQLFLLFRK